MTRRRLTLAGAAGAALLLLLAAPGAQASANGAAFGRLQREMAGASTASLSATLMDAAAAVAGATQQQAAPEGEEEAATGPVDSWATIPALKVARRLMKGGTEGVGGFLQEMAMGKEFEEIFSHPEAAHLVIQRFPMFQAFEGVKELAAKAKEDFTQEDGLSVLASLRKFVATGVAGLSMVADPGKYADFMSRYADLADGAEPADERETTLQKLLNGAKIGDKDSILKLHDLVANDVWGGAVDLEEFGSRGVEPATLKQLRELAMEDLDIWNLITGGDPLVDKILSGPTLPFEMIPDFEPKVAAATSA